MNSYMRQTPADQMHSFLRDKQAWENAIAMYQGPDPLDHWYNYVCWYENHGHGDPENKLRETLERCLTQYEHSDYYKQDLRMVRLWLKYIDMQPNPLHFYQVLYQRGVGRQVAAFYISWAGYYESIHALKEAESVYSLGFQEKAQSFEELHHAHSKLLYARTQIAQQQQQQLAKPATQQLQPTQQIHHQQQQQQLQQVHYQTQQQQHGIGVHAAPTHAHVHAQPQTAQMLSPQMQNFRAHDAYQSQPTQQQTTQIHHGQTPSSPQQQQLPQQQQQIYQHVSYQQNHQPTAQFAHHQQQQLQQHQLQLQQQHHHAQHATAAATTISEQNATASYVPPQVSHLSSANAVPPIEQQLPAVNAQAAHHQHQQQQQQQQHQQQSSNPTVAADAANNEISTQIPGIKLPRKFAMYCHNNNETWTPALFLEEPADPCRHCHYAKNLVYPEGSVIEYSPEEIRVRKYAERLQELKRQRETAAAQAQQEQKIAQQQHHAQQQQQQQQLQEIGNITMQRQMQQQQQQHAHKESTVQQANAQMYTYYGAEYHQQLQTANSNTTTVQQHQVIKQQSYLATQVHNVAATSNVADEENEADVNAEGEALADAEEYGDNEEDEEDDDEEQYNYANRLNYTQQQQQQQNHHHHHQQQHSQPQQQVVNTVDDLEDQIEASTIRFSMHTPEQGNQNKTLKIKFKKERQTSNNSFNGNSNYSAYTIERIYQPDVASPTTTHEAQQSVRRNGHSFHPYMLGQTSTPKTSTPMSAAASALKRNKTKLKRFNAKFQMAVNNCSSSNSSSAENAVAGIGTPASGNDKGFMNGSGITGNAPIADVCDNAIQNANFNDNANYSFSSAVALENSNCSLSSAVGRLNFRDSVAGANTNAANTTCNAVADYSTYQENSYFATQHDTEAKERRLQKALETIERHLAKEAIDPFSSELCRAFLTKLDFPGADDAHANYKIIQTPLPKLSIARTLILPEVGVHFNIDKEVGRGSYGSVYKTTDVNSGAVVALKFQKPPNIWEIYICDQVLKRVQSSSILPGLMDISTAIIAPNASLIATEFSPFGSLLDINNKIRQATTKVMHESLVMHFSSQICNIIHHLHMNKIIHADIKPDNFLLMRVPSTDLHFPSLRLIDFGCAIDMTLFPDENTKFRKIIQTDGFTCIEMQEGRPWSYETDLFCIAGTVHVMLFGEYMQLVKRANVWDIKQKLPRYLKKHVWTKFFNEMLNIKPDAKMADLSELRCIFEAEAAKMDSELQSQIRALSNILYRR